MRKPDVPAILQHSYACGLPRHEKDTRVLVDYIEYLEQKINNKGEQDER